MFTTTNSSQGRPRLAAVARVGGGSRLIQLLVLVVVLAVLAAISFANASASARRGSLGSSVRAIRGQVAVYTLEHGDELPDLAAASAAGRHFQPLTNVTAHGGVRRGPYLPSVPVNPLTGGSMIKDATSLGADGLPSPVPGADFIYDYRGGSGTGNLWGTSDREAGTPVTGSD